MAATGIGDAILALDIGTSSTRAVLYDAATGQAITGAATARHHEAHAGADGESTLDAEQILREVVECAQGALAQTPPGVAVVAVAACTFWHSFVGVDASGQAVTPILLWSDRRSFGQTARLRLQLDAGYTSRTGCPVHTSYPPGRLLWLGEKNEDAFAKCVRFLSPGEYVYARLFGLERIACSFSMASGTGLLDQARGEWDAQTLALLPGATPDTLSPLNDAPVSGLVGEWRDALPALANVPWFPALGDGACSNMGCGATGPDRLALMIGTSGAVRVMIAGDATVSVPPVPEGLWRYMSERNRFLVGGALSNGGSVWAWLTGTLNIGANGDDGFEQAIAVLAPDAHGLTVLPFLSGERAPLWRDDLTATFAGVTRTTTSVEIGRASLEAVAYRFAAIRERLRPLTPQADIIGTGAALTASPVWAQILADVLGETILVSDEEQASARGAALWAREKLGLGTIGSAEPPPICANYEPDAVRHAVYVRGRARHEDFLRRLNGP